MLIASLRDQRIVLIIVLFDQITQINVKTDINMLNN